LPKSAPKTSKITHCTLLGIVIVIRLHCKNIELQAVSAQKNNRLISGNRVICRCSLELPKVDAFSNFQTDRQGYLSFNTRGGALYMGQQFTPLTINKVFNGDEAATLKNVVLYPPELPEVRLGQIDARFLQFTQGQKFRHTQGSQTKALSGHFMPRCSSHQ